MRPGSVVKAYRDAWTSRAIVRDAAAIDGAPAERLARAAAVPGTFYSPLPLRNYLPYGRELLDQGLEAAAVVAFERAAQANPSASTLYRLGTLLAKSGETRAGARGVRARAGAAARPGRGQQRSRRAARAGRRPRRRPSRGSARRSRRRPTIPTR